MWISWVRAALGGALIGLGAAMLLFFNGRIAGVSGVLGDAFLGDRAARGFRLAFLGGLLAAGAVLAFASPSALATSMARGPLWLAASGLLVGYGTRLANGCTSGHGVCGNARLSPRSMVATATFILAGMAAAFVLGHVIGRS